MEIAVIGSGIAGLAASFELDKLGHDVTLFERHSNLGLSNHAIEFASDESSCVIDVPLRLMNQHQWPTLWDLYKTLQVDVAKVNGSLSFVKQNRSYLQVDFDRIFSTNLLGLTKSTNRKIFHETLKLRETGLRDLDALSKQDDVSLAEYLSKHEFSNDFIYGFLYPLLSSTVFTCSYQALAAYPACIVLESLAKITSSDGQVSQSLFRAKHGTPDVVDRIMQDSIEVKLNSTVEGIARLQEQVAVDHETEKRQLFDHVVIATQANHVPGILANPTSQESEMASCFEYETVQVDVHQDKSLMPNSRKNWSAFNMDVGEDTTIAARCTIWLNRFAPELNLQDDVFQTIHAVPGKRPDKAICQVHLQRPVVTEKSFRGWQLIEQMHADKRRRIWFAGSYAHRGVPLLETGIASAQNVARLINDNARLALT